MGRQLVQLSYYSTRQPVSGGQKRIAALRNELTALGYCVHPIEVFAWMEPLHPDDFKFQAYDDEWARRFNGEYEGRVADVLLANGEFAGRVAERIAGYAPDILWLEQPFLWPFVRLRLEAFGRPQLVYSSHNVEWQVRAELAERTGLAPLAAMRIQEIECDLTRSADLVVAVSQPDEAWFASSGARRTVLARNASDGPGPTVNATARQDFRHDHDISEDAVVLLYVSAYWEPNWLGLADWCLEPLERLAERFQIILLLVGGVGIRAAQADLPDAQRCMIVSTGEIAEADKAAAYAAADAVLLPVVAGGGTNLKTAEALLGDLPVIATTYAMRGLEALGSLDGVTVSDNKQAFALELARLVEDISSRRKQDAPFRRTRNDRVSQLCSWSGALAPLGTALTETLDS